MEISKKDLRKLSLDFRVAAGRLLRSDFNDVPQNIRRFLAFIEGAPVLLSYVQGCSIGSIDFEEAISKRDRYTGFNLPADVVGEVAFTYGLLLHLDKNKVDPVRYCHGYGSGNKFQAHFEGFSRRVLNPFVQHLESHVQELMMDAGMTDTATVNVDVSGTVHQLNLAANGSQITASNVTSITSLESSFRELLHLVQREQGLSPDQKDEVRDLGEMIVFEAKKPVPKKAVIRAGYEQLKNLATLAVLSNETAQAVEAFVKFIQPFLGH